MHIFLVPSLCRPPAFESLNSYQRRSDREGIGKST